MKRINIGLRTSNGGRVVLPDPGRRGFAYITINSHVVRKNAINGTDVPPIRVAKSQRDKSPRCAREVVIVGPSQLLYSANEPIMGCGARLVLLAVAGDVKGVR